MNALSAGDGILIDVAPAIVLAIARLVGGERTLGEIWCTSVLFMGSIELRV